jgi:hypothetical protein
MRSLRWIGMVGAAVTLTMGTLVVGALGSGPAGAATTFAVSAMQTNVSGSMNAVSCPSAGSCVAVGYAPATGQMLAETLANGSWTATTLTSSFALASLQGVWCASVTSCIAVGQGGATTATEQPLVVTLSGTTWGISASDLLPSGQQSEPGVLNSISCLSVTSCVAVGSFSPAAAMDEALFATLSGTSWSATSTASPSGATVTVAKSVQCVSATSCQAVGYWSANPATSSNGLLETLSGTTWTATTLGQAGDYLTSLSCPAAGSCMALGYNIDGNGVSDLLANGQWSLNSFTPPSGIAFNQLNGLSCTPTIATCVAVGGYREPPTSGTVDTLVMLYSSGTWTAFLELDPSGQHGLGNGVACPTISSCVGVGVLNNGATTYPMAAIETTGSSGGGGGGGGGTTPHGYWLVGSDGGIFTFGSAQFYGSTGSLVLNRPVVGITPMRGNTGYWLVASDGGVFTFGSGPYLGSIPGLGIAPAGTSVPGHLNAPIVGLVPSSDGNGYFMVGADGGVFAFGDAAYEGSCPGIGGCSGLAVGVAPDSTGHGYWLLTKTGQVYNFGDAPNLGQPGTQASPFTSLVRTPDGLGFWALDGSGNVYAFGDAPYLGALPAGSTFGLDPATAIFATSDGGGYWVSTAVGRVYAFGDAPADGDMSGTHLNGAIIAASGY